MLFRIFCIIRLQFYILFTVPRLAALAEVGWTSRMKPQWFRGLFNFCLIADDSLRSDSSSSIPILFVIRISLNCWNPSRIVFIHCVFQRRKSVSKDVKKRGRENRYKLISRRCRSERLSKLLKRITWLSRSSGVSQ